jgi:hypothetical protein
LKFDEGSMYIKRDKYFVLNPNISTWFYRRSMVW